MSFKIGVMVDSFRVGVKEGIRKAAEIGAEGIQVYATEGFMAPENLSKGDRSSLLKYIKDSGLGVSALCSDFGGRGFEIKEDNPWRIEKTKRIMNLAADLETRVVTTHIGRIPEDKNCELYKVLSDACSELAAYGEKTGISFAIETGGETSLVLKEFLDSFKSRHIGANFDPANLMSRYQEDASQAVYNLRDYILHTHAKDSGKRMTPTGERYIETPLGEGQVDFKGFLNALKDVGYDSFLTIEREVGDNPEADIRTAVSFLKSLMK